MKRMFFLCLALASVMGKVGAQSDKELESLARLMQGSFSSADHAKRDSSYYSISLKIIPVWEQRTDGIWMYIEQALASNLDKPYRQRVYHLSRTADEQFESAVYTINNPLRFAGKPELLINLSPDSLTLREGCSVFITKRGKNHYTGKTGNQSCPSELRGAAYASSEVEITRKVLISWDRGFDSDGKQVWGAEKGGYEFKKLKGN